MFWASRAPSICFGVPQLAGCIAWSSPKPPSAPHRTPHPLTTPLAAHSSLIPRTTHHSPLLPRPKSLGFPFLFPFPYLPTALSPASTTKKYPGVSLNEPAHSLSPAEPTPLPTPIPQRPWSAPKLFTSSLIDPQPPPFSLQLFACASQSILLSVIPHPHRSLHLA